MKIAFIIQDRRIIYGAERATADLASALNARSGFEAHISLISETRLGAGESPFKEKLIEQGVSVTEVPTTSSFSPALVRDLRAVIDHVGADVVHTIGPKATVHSFLAFKSSGKPLVSTLHGWLFRPDVKERLHEYSELFALRRFDCVVVLSSYYRDLLVQKCVSGKKVRRIPTGFSSESDRSENSDSAKPGDPIVFGMMGRLSSEKNHGMLLEAIRHLGEASDKARFLIAGEGPLGDYLKSMAADLNVEFRGYTKPERFLEEVDALILCSKIENLPYSILEAMAQGVPTIATRVGGIPDLIDDGQSGILVPANDEDALAQALARVIDDPGWIAEAGHTAREKLHREFRLESSIDAHIALYRSLA